MTRILAIDPGFERVGIAVLEKNGADENLLYSDCFTTPSGEPFEKRLFAIGEELKRIVRRYAPNVCAIETLFYNTNQKTAMRVAEARGAMILVAINAGLRLYEYTPLQIKIALTGYGRASKEQVSAMVKKLVALPLKEREHDDELDAIALALTHSAHERAHLSTGQDSSSA